jgi:alkanesulfonate monooxygenase SsuD/methylene tetrahydromethanopterin reductase-like flavin-dependent oxidoreductase (luciferase family)
MQPVQLFCWHFMAYPYLAENFDQVHDSGWVTVPNSLWDNKKARGLYQEYIDQLAYADELGFDGMVLNEHHQNIYGLMPSPNLIAAAEYAMLDQMSNGRLIAGFAPGGGPETFNYDIPSANTREKFWEAADLIVRSWTEDGPFAHEGRYFPLRYVNPWPKPLQAPFPPIWIPGSRSPSTMTEVAKRGYCYFLSSRSHGGETHRAQQEFAAVLEKHGDRYQPFRFGILMSAYVAETDRQAREECEEGVWYFLKNCLKGHLRREGRQLTFGPGVPYIPAPAWKEYLKEYKPGRKLLGDVENWDELEASQSIIVGSPETVYQRIWNLIERAKVGNLLIQFHIGNMSKELALKSMTLFAEQVAPRLRENSLAFFEQEYPSVHIDQQKETRL